MPRPDDRGVRLRLSGAASSVAATADEWGGDLEEDGERLRFVYGKLAAIRKAHPALSGPHVFPADNHPDGYGVINDQIVIYHRYGDTSVGLARYIVVINFGDQDQRVTVPFSTDGEWKDLLNDELVNVSGFRHPDCRIPSNWGRIFYHLEP